MTTADLRPHAISREVYGTITVTSVLIVYDGWGKVTMLDAIVVMVGPVLAMYIGHCFAASLAGQVAHGRPLTRRELLATARAESGFLLLAVPPLVVLVVLTTAGAALSDAIRVVIWVSAASLGFWGGFAARRAGSAGWRVARGVLGGLLVGGIVLALQVFLQPGEAVSNGVAAAHHPRWVRSAPGGKIESSRSPISTARSIASCAMTCRACGRSRPLRS